MSSRFPARAEIQDYRTFVPSISLISGVMLQVHEIASPSHVKYADMGTNLYIINRDTLASVTASAAAVDVGAFHV